MKERLFITGASSGIGLATARLFSANGHEVWGTSRDPKRLPELPGFHPLALNLAEPKTIEKAFETAWKESGGIDLLINNAGAGFLGSAEDTTIDTWREQYEVLLFGPWRLAQLALPRMRDRGRGTIINITSLAARFPIPYMAPYSSAKAALATATETLILEQGDGPVRIIDLQPGDIDTPFVAHSPCKEEGGLCGVGQMAATEAMKDTMAHSPQPEIVAQKIAALVHSEAPSGRYTVGAPAQTMGAFWAERLLPRAWVRAALRKLYRL